MLRVPDLSSMGAPTLLGTLRFAAAPGSAALPGRPNVKNASRPSAGRQKPRDRNSRTQRARRVQVGPLALRLIFLPHPVRPGS